MTPYLKQTEHAVRNLLELICENQKRHDEICCEIDWLEWVHAYDTQEVEQYLDRQNMEPSYEFLAEKYLTECGQELYEKKEEQKLLGINIRANKVSSDALSTAVLQIARQGLSIKYSHSRRIALNKCKGILGHFDIPIAQIIWDGRNHAIHYEESPQHNENTKNLFKLLKNYYGDPLSLEKNPHKSLAGELIKILGWKTYEVYFKDMEALLK